MSRLSDLWNRIELIAKKMEVSVEDLILIIEGKSKTHSIVQTHTPVNPPSAGTAAAGSPASVTPHQPSAPSVAAAGEEHPTTSGHAAASAGVKEPSADSTEAVLPAIEEAAHNED